MPLKKQNLINIVFAENKLKGNKCYHWSEYLHIHWSVYIDRKVNKSWILMVCHMQFRQHDYHCWVNH